MAARDGLEEALAYRANESPIAAAALLDEALDAAESLSTLSDRGRAVPELEDGRAREIFVQRYRMVYEVASDRVEVVAFVHSARDFETWWRNRGDAP